MSKKTKEAGSHIRQAVMSTLVLLVICGLAYPVLMTGLGKLLFPKQAGGNLVTADGQAVGSEFVGQDFTDPRFMKCRPSQYNYNTYIEQADGTLTYSDGETEYAGLSSGSANYANSNPALAERVSADIEEFLEANPDVKKEEIPTDLLTASGSGLDPHITPASAKVQIPALADATGLSEEQLQQIVDDNTEGKVLGVFGEDRVNVLGVNLDIAQELGLIGAVEK